MFDEQDARRRAAEPARLRRRLRRPRRGHQHRDRRRFVPLVSVATPVLTNIAAPGDQLQALLRLAGPGGRDRRPGRGDPGRAVGEPRPHARRVRGRRAAVPSGDDLEGPEGAADRDRHVPRDPALLRRDRRSSSTTSSPAPQRSATLRRRSRTRSRRHGGAARVARLQQAAPGFLSDLQDFAQDPVVPIGLKDLFDTVEALDPTLTYLTPTQTVCNYVVALLPQRREPAERRRPERHVAAVHGDHDARRARTAAPRPTARAARPMRPRTVAAA